MAKQVRTAAADWTEMQTRRYHRIEAVDYLRYLLLRLDGLIDAFARIRATFPADSPLLHIVTRESRDEIVRLLRLQYILHWNSKEVGRHPYYQACLEPKTPLDVDHVIPLRTLSATILAAEGKARHRLFVRAWLAPVALIGRTHHAMLRNTSDCTTEAGFPFARYEAADIEVHAFGQPIDRQNFSIQDHYTLLRRSPGFACLLDVTDE